LFGLNIKKQLKEKDDKIKDLESKRKSLNDRVVELENAIEKDYGVKVREEINIVDIGFDKQEASIMLAGIDALIGGSTYIDDIKVYIKLYDKIVEVIDRVPEKGIDNE
jgi:hypothetical protein